MESYLFENNFEHIQIENYQCESNKRKKKPEYRKETKRRETKQNKNSIAHFHGSWVNKSLYNTKRHAINQVIQKIKIHIPLQ